MSVWQRLTQQREASDLWHLVPPVRQEPGWKEGEESEQSEMEEGVQDMLEAEEEAVQAEQGASWLSPRCPLLHCLLEPRTA